ncbi:hypothetical protein [Caulobacter sp. B11]|uniref:hypothetical protein n=1 Tax=Caulobacter sp. B11 TaxID=2048899 RepID=UPI0013747C2D|nr:hypothetical protein [Caulobacter sp. B11]
MILDNLAAHKAPPPDRNLIENTFSKLEISTERDATRTFEQIWALSRGPSAPHTQ